MKKNKQLLSGLVIAFVLSSCSVNKGVYLSGYHFNWRNNNNCKGKEQVVDNRKTESTTAAQTSEVISIENTVANENDFTASTEKSISVPATPKIDWNKKNKITTSNRSTTSTEIKKIIQTQKKKHSKNASHPDTTAKKFHWAAITGFVTGLVGLFVAGIVLGICAVVFSTIAIVKITKNGEEYRGLGMAIAGLILGILDIVLVAILLAILL